MARHKQLLFEGDGWRAIFSSKRGDWETPQEFFDALDTEFHFTLDVSATPSNAKCRHYFTPEVDGLKQQWTGVIWMNPPYGRDIDRWVKKAFDSAVSGATCVALLPVRSDTKWSARFVSYAEVRFITGRLRFGGATSSAPFPSAIAIWRPGVVLSKDEDTSERSLFADPSAKIE